jgi:hypothetical protein
VGGGGAQAGLFVTDGNRIRRISAAGVVTTFAGDAAAAHVDADGVSARFSGPRGVCVDRQTECLYVADTDNHRCAGPYEL